MNISDDIRRGNKTKHSKNEILKSTIVNYLQKRNYNLSDPIDIPKHDLQLYSSVKNQISNPNSILYRFYNCDPVIVDSNFLKFLNWIREIDQEESRADLEQLIGPLFCHLYLDILQGGHPEKAAAFFLSHLATVENVNQNTFIQELIRNLSAENGSDILTQEFRSNKYILYMREKSKLTLMNFVGTHCHVIILQELQTWFEIQKLNNEITEMESNLIPNECCLSSKFQKILNVSKDLENTDSNNIYNVNISNVISEINCGILSRYHGWFIYDQNNLVFVNTLSNSNSLNEQDSQSVRLNGHSSKVYAVTISKNYISTGSSDGKICIYNVEDFEIIKECLGHTRTVYCLKISNNEFYLASGSEDNTVRLWSVGNGQFLRIFVGHLQAVVSLDFHPNCLYLISGSCDNTVRFWAIDNATAIRLLHGIGGTVRYIACHPQGKILCTTSDDQYIRIWDILTGKVLSETKNRDALCKLLKWSKDGNFLCGAFSDGTVKIWVLKIQDKTIGLQTVQTVNCGSTIIDLEYCFGSFGMLTTKTNFHQ